MSIARRLVVLVGAAALACTFVGLTADVAAAAPSSQDRAFLVAAHQNNLTEIQAGRAALKKSSNDVVRRHGQLFITDHTRLDADLRAVAQQLNVSLPSQPNAKQRATLASVSALSGTAFDAAWLRSQLTGHRQAKADGQRELSQGSDGQVKGLARAAAPVIQMHLAMLQEATGTPSGLATGNGGQAATRSGGRAGLGTGLLGLGGVLVAAAALVLRRRRRTA
jgi:putative membrane protein